MILRPFAQLALFFCLFSYAIAGTPPVLVADRTAVRPGEPVSLALTLADASPYVVIGARNEINHWFSVRADGSTQPVPWAPWEQPTENSTVADGTIGTVSRFYTNTVAASFEPRFWPITIQAKNSFGQSEQIDVWVGPQPNPAAGSNVWINHTTATYALTRVKHAWSTTTDGDGNTETVYDTTDTTTETLLPGGTFTITNISDSAEDGSWSTGEQDTVTLVVATNQLFAPLTLNRSVVSDSAVTLVWPAVANGAAPVDYVIYRDGLPVGTTGALTYTDASLAAGVTYTYTVKSRQSGVILSPAGPALIVTTSPLTILTQPANATLAAGATAYFAVTASGPPPLTYQWRKNEVPVAGQTGSVLTLASVTDTDTARYSVVVTSAAGSATSAIATLSVNSVKPVISTTGAIAGTVGVPLSFTIPATNFPTVFYRLHGYFPEGVSLNAATGLITGIPTNSGSFSATVAAGNSGGMALGTVSFVIADAPPQAVPALQPREVRITAQGNAANQPPFRIQVGSVGSTVVASSGETATNYITEVSISVNGVPNYWSAAINAPTLDMVFTDALSPHNNGAPRTGYRVTVRWTDYFAYDYTSEDEDGNSVSVVGISARDSVLYDETFPRPPPVPRVPNPLAINFPYPDSHVLEQGAFSIFGYAAGYSYTPVIFVIDSGPARIETQVMESTQTTARIVPTGVGAVVVTAYAPGESGYTSAVPVTRVIQITGTPPAITAHPVSVAVTAGRPASLSVTAIGSPPLTYKWHRGYRADGTNNIVGAVSTTSRTLVFPNAPVEATGNYWCEVTGWGGSVTSGVANLTASPPPSPPPPTITTVSPISIVTNVPFSLPIATTSPASSFIWDEGSLPAGVTFFSGPGLIQGTPTTAAIGTYVVKLRPFGGPQSTLTIQVTNGSGQSPPVFTTQPESKTVAAGSLVQLNAQATGVGPISYQWYKDGNPLFDQRSAALTLLAATAADVGYYAVVARNSLGATSSQAVTLTVSGVAPTGSTTGQAGSLPNITTQPQDTSVMPGEPARFAVNASSVTPLSYQWLRNGIAVDGATSDTLVLPEPNYRDNGARYAVAVTNGAGTVQSDEAMLLVRTPVLSVSNLTATSFRLSWLTETIGGQPVRYRIVIPGVCDMPAATSPYDVPAVLMPQTTYAVTYDAHSPSGELLRSVTAYVTTLPFTASPAAAKLPGLQARALTAAGPAFVASPSHWLEVWRWVLKPNGTQEYRSDGLRDEVRLLNDSERQTKFVRNSLTIEYQYIFPLTESTPFMVNGFVLNFSRSDAYEPWNEESEDGIDLGYWEEVDRYEGGYVEFEAEAGVEYSVYSFRKTPNEANSPDKWVRERDLSAQATTARVRIPFGYIKLEKREYRLVRHSQPVKHLTMPLPVPYGGGNVVFGVGPANSTMTIPGIGTISAGNGSLSGSVTVGGITMGGSVGPGGVVSGEVTLPNIGTISVGPNGVTVTPSGGASSVLSNGASLPLPGGAGNIAVDIAGNATLTLPDGSEIRVGPDGSATLKLPGGGTVSRTPGGGMSAQLPGGFGITRSADGKFGLTLPRDILSILIGGTDASGNPQNTSGGAIWGDEDAGTIFQPVAGTGGAATIGVPQTDADRHYSVRQGPTAPPIYISVGRAPDIPSPPMRSRDRFLTGSFDTSSDRVRTGLIEFVTATGQVLGAYKLDGSTGTHIYDSQDEILSDGELDRVVAGSLTATSPRMSQQVVFWRTAPGSSTIRFSTVFPEVGDVKIRVTAGAGQPTEIAHTLSAEPNFGGLLDHLGARITSIQMPAVSSWSLLPPINGIDDEPTSVIASAEATGGRQTIVRAVFSSADMGTGSHAVLSSAANNFLAKVATYADQAVGLADFAGIATFKVGGGFIKGFIDGFHDGVVSDVEGAQALTDMIAFSFVGDFTRVKAMADGIKALIAKVTSPGGVQELFDQMLGKIVDKAQVSVPWDSVGDNTDQWGERAYIIGYTGGFLTEQIVATLVAGNLAIKAGQAVKLALTGQVALQAVSATKKFTTGMFFGATKHVAALGSQTTRSVRRAIAEVGRLPIDGGNTVADLVSALSEGLGGGVKITYKELVDPLALVCQSRDEWLKLGMTAKYHFATLSSRLGLNLTKSSVRGFQNLWKGALRNGDAGDFVHHLYAVCSPGGVLDKQGLVKILEMFDGAGTSAFKFSPQPTDPKKWVSPAGITYEGQRVLGGPPREGHRIMHLLHHSVDDVGRTNVGTPHGVFTVPRPQIFELLDYVWSNWNTLSRRPVPNRPNTWDIDLPSFIGRANNSAQGLVSYQQTKTLRIGITTDGTITTAFPVNP